MAQLSPQVISALMAPLNPLRVKSRKEAGVELHYVPTHYTIAALNAFFGFGGWTWEVEDCHLLYIREAQTHPAHVGKDGKSKTPQAAYQVKGRLSIPRLEWSVSEVAVGSNSGWDIGNICDTAIKSASSEALKRCARQLGNQFGLSLYEPGQGGPGLRPLVDKMVDPEQSELLAQWREQHAKEIAEAQEAEKERMAKAVEMMNRGQDEGTNTPGE